MPNERISRQALIWRDVIMYRREIFNKSECRNYGGKTDYMRYISAAKKRYMSGYVHKWRESKNVVLRDIWRA